MQIRTSSDWRDDLPFETPRPAAEVMPGEPSRCAMCPAQTPLHPRDELWIVKHRHPNNPAGFVRFYCAVHRPAPPVAAASSPSATSRRGRSEPRESVRRAAVPERVAAVCPTCFVEVPATRICGVCGERVS